MIRNIANNLNECIKQKAWADCAGGLVRSHNIPVTNKDKTVSYRTAPVDCGVPDPCDDECLKPLLPDDRFKSVSYFEAPNGYSVIGRGKNYTEFQANLIWRVWLNVPKLGLDSCDICGLVVCDFNDCVEPFNRVNVPPLSNIRCKMLQVLPKDARQWSQYTYADPDKMQQYLGLPYDFCSILVECKWMANSNCWPDFPVNPPIDCP